MNQEMARAASVSRDGEVLDLPLIFQCRLFGVDPVAEHRAARGRRRGTPSPPAPRRPHDPIVRPERPSSSVRPRNQEFLDGAAVDLTIVRPAAAAPPRRLEQVEQHRGSV